MISKKVSIDIVTYLQKEKGLSVDEIAQSLDTSVETIKGVLKSEQLLTPDNVNFYLKSSDLPFWEFCVAAIPMEHIPEKARNRILLCEELSKHIKKKRRK